MSKATNKNIYDVQSEDFSSNMVSENDWFDDNSAKSETESIDFQIPAQITRNKLDVPSYSNESIFDFLEKARNSTENKINNVRLSDLKDKTKDFLHLLKEEHFEFGFTSRSEEFIKSYLRINALATRNWINDIFIQNFHEEAILIGVLRILGRFEPSEIFPQGQTMAMAAFNHKTDEVKELGVRAFESWGGESSSRILKSISLDTAWLKEYVDQVIADLDE